MHSRIAWILAVLILTATVALAQDTGPANAVGTTDELLFSFDANQASGYHTGLFVRSGIADSCKVFTGPSTEEMQTPPANITGTSVDSVGVRVHSLCQSQYGCGFVFASDGFGGVPTKSMTVWSW